MSEISGYHMTEDLNCRVLLCERW